MIRSSIYSINPGDFHNAGSLRIGDIPLVSCGAADNGITGFVDVGEEFIYDHKLTIALNGMNTLTAKYHPYKFAAKDDVAVCTPLKKIGIQTEVFIQVMLSREQWRYSYYRKCFVEKLKRFEVRLPVNEQGIDEDIIDELLCSSAYWGFIKQIFA